MIGPCSAPRAPETIGRRCVAPTVIASSCACSGGHGRALHTGTGHSYVKEHDWGVAQFLVLHRTDGAHRPVVYSRSRQSRLHLTLIIKNGERVSLRGAPKAPRIYTHRWPSRASGLTAFSATRDMFLGIDWQILAGEKVSASRKIAKWLVPLPEPNATFVHPISSPPR
jgi:hypothetical protein